jgi:hypothetical protein
MSADNLAPLHELLKDPIRQKTLLLLGERDRLSFDDLVKQLKIDDQEELHNQLKILGDLVTKVEDDEYSLTEQGVSKRPGGQYMLTEKGHDAVDEMVAFPEIESENYKQIVNKKFFGKRALAHHKLAYILGGAAGGYCVSFFGGAFISIISVTLFHGPGLGSFDDGWPFFGTVLFIAPIVGGLVGYLIGEKKRFKRPEPEWDD